MAIIVTVGSGKGGTGKSMVVTNIACLLARRGKEVCLLDLDVGGANAHILFGQFDPPASLTDFLERKVEKLEDVAIPFPPLKNLKLIAGTGETLKTSNMPYATKQRLIKNLGGLAADIILVDVGAGTSYHALDFFMLGDYQLCVTTPDPTATLDLYRFVKLAVVRKVLTSFVSYDAISEILVRRDFKTVEDIFQLAEELGPPNLTKAQKALAGFYPMLIINQAKKGTRVSTRRLEQLMSEYLGVKLERLGTIPEDPAVEESVRFFMPVCEVSPNAPASKALYQITDRLLDHIASSSP